MGGQLGIMLTTFKDEKGRGCRALILRAPLYIDFSKSFERKLNIHFYFIDTYFLQDLEGKNVEK